MSSQPLVTIVETREFIRRIDNLMNDDERAAARGQIREATIMSKAANSIRKGLEEAVAYAKGRGAKKGYRVHVPEHVGKAFFTPRKTEDLQAGPLRERRPKRRGRSRAATRRPRLGRRSSTG